MARFILRRLGQLADESVIDDVLDNLDTLHPVFLDVIRYLEELRHLGAADKKLIGGKVLDLLETSPVSELEYHRMWALELFTRSVEWDNEDSLLNF